MVASSNGQEQVKNLKQDKDATIILTMLEGTFQLVMTMTTATTVGDQNKKLRVRRWFTWIELVLVTSGFIANTAAIVYSVCTKPSSWDYAWPWRLLVVVLLNAYLAVVYLAMGYLTLFLPQAPFAAWEALYQAAFKGIGIAAIGATCVVVLLFDQAWLHIHFACLLGLLIAAVLASCLWLARTYRQQTPLTSSNGLDVV